MPGSIIHNNAVLTVRTEEAEPRQVQGIATSVVAVDLLRGLLGENKDIRHLSPHGGSGVEENPLAPQNPNPYNPQLHSEASLVKQGHGNHTGPVWFPGITVQVGGHHRTVRSSPTGRIIRNTTGPRVKRS